MYTIRNVLVAWIDQQNTVNEKRKCCNIISNANRCERHVHVHTCESCYCCFFAFLLHASWFCAERNSKTNYFPFALLFTWCRCVILCCVSSNRFPCIYPILSQHQMDLKPEFTQRIECLMDFPFRILYSVFHEMISPPTIQLMMAIVCLLAFSNCVRDTDGKRYVRVLVCIDICRIAHIRTAYLHRRIGRCDCIAEEKTIISVGIYTKYPHFANVYTNIWGVCVRIWHVLVYVLLCVFIRIRMKLRLAFPYILTHVRGLCVCTRIVYTLDFHLRFSHYFSRVITNNFVSYPSYMAEQRRKSIFYWISIRISHSLGEK